MRRSRGRRSFTSASPRKRKKFRRIVQSRRGWEKRRLSQSGSLRWPRHTHAVPRRLAYVVNRRTVVDQTTDEVKKLRANLDKRWPVWKTRLKKLCVLPMDCPLAVSTLRGALAERPGGRQTLPPGGGRWHRRLDWQPLFFSVDTGRLQNPAAHAGLLGQDTLIVHDEAHLEPAFQTLLEGHCHEGTKLREVLT